MKSKFLLILLFIFIPNVKAFEINSKSAIMYNLNNDTIIYEKNSEERLPMASLTKIMTSIVAIENITDFNKEIVITYDMIKGLVEQDAYVLGYKVGDHVTLIDLLYASLLPSAADATQALAISISGSVDEFINLMNLKAKELGLTNTSFKNTTGLDKDGHYSTAKDIATLLKYCLKNETFKKIYTTKSYVTKSGTTLNSNLEKNIKRYNLNIDYIDGSKTGYTTKAGLCLSSIVSHDKIDYLLVTLGAKVDSIPPANITDTDTIYKYYFENYKYYNILKKDKELLKLNNKYYKDDYIVLSPVEFSMYMEKSDYENLTYEYVGEDNISIFSKKLIGKYNVKLNDDILYSVDIIKTKVPFSILLFLYKYLYIIIPILILIIYGYKKISTRKLKN